MTRIYVSYPKINIFFKIIGILPNGYCDILSRYIKVQNSIFDTLEIKDSASFSLNGDFKCPLHSNTIFKAKLALQEYLDLISKHKESKYLDSFSISVDKKIPIFAGLGGGSSNAGVYLLAINEILELGIPKSTLANIGAKIGADVSFFVYDYKSSNVSGFGGKIEEFVEEKLEFEIFTPPIDSHTNAVFAEFKKDFKIDIIKSKEMISLKSLDLLRNFSIDALNDLYLPATRIYKEILSYYKDGYFFSGSGSSFFRLK